MARVKIWLHAARFRTLPLSLSGIILGSAVAYNDDIFKWDIFILALFTTLFFQVLSNFANDLGDTLKGADNTERVGPMRTVQSGEISISQMKKAVILLSVLSLISATLLIYVSSSEKGISFWFFYLTLASFCVIAAILYTIGKKAYGYLGLGDVFVFLFFGLVSVIGVYHLYPDSLSLASLEWKLFLPATTIGLLSSAVLNLNNMRDCENDKKVGKHTLVVKIGIQKAKIYHTLLIIIAILSLLIYIGIYHTDNYFFYSLFIPILLLIKHVNTIWKTSSYSDFDPHLKTVALTTFLTSLLFACSILIHHV